MTDTVFFFGRSFRVVPPRWAHDPLSGEGARMRGGRFNPPGMAAFYSALEPHTAYAEYTQALYDRPGLLCSFVITQAVVLDLANDGHLERAGLVRSDLSARWFGLGDAPSQLAATRPIASGIDGLVYPSLQHSSGRNLVLWRFDATRIQLVDRIGEALTLPLAGSVRTSHGRIDK